MTSLTRKSLLVVLVWAVGTFIVRAGDLTVRINRVRSGEGQIVVAIFSSTAAWNKETPAVTVQQIAASKKGAVMHFQLPPGTYALQVLHDENDNGRLDSNSAGIPNESHGFGQPGTPSEGYGFSHAGVPSECHGPSKRMSRRATFKDAEFEITDEPMTLIVCMMY